MSLSSRFLTIDYGAESGRALLGEIHDGRLQLSEVHRFPNEPQRILGSFNWDTVRLFADAKVGIRKASGHLDGIGVDTWGVDFALLDSRDNLVGLPVHYRDHRTDTMLHEAFSRVPREDIYAATGIQFMQINTLYQLLALRLGQPEQLDRAKSLLFTPDLINYWLTGEKANEFTIASTSQCHNPQIGDWARDILARLDLPVSLFQPIRQPGELLGRLHPAVQRDTGAGDIPVYLPATHDTGSAVAAVPAEGKSGWAYISCGTWSLVGVETTAPVITPQSLEYNLTNEGGVFGTTRLLRNVMGLWLLQECRRGWEREGTRYEYTQLSQMSEGAPAFAAAIDPDDDRFLNPHDMSDAIRAYCFETGQKPPESPAAITRCIIESLAMKYRWVIERLERVTGDLFDTIHVIGGGSQNKTLCQAAADASGRRVLAGPIEATAAGNVLVQAIGAGRLESLAAGREMIRLSFPMEEYLPRDSASWESHYQKFAARIG
ncbi:MAG: rhamnulokinase family protein [Chthonomonadales bacterium]